MLVWSHSILDSLKRSFNLCAFLSRIGVSWLLWIHCFIHSLRKVKSPSYRFIGIGALRFIIMRETVIWVVILHALVHLSLLLIEHATLKVLRRMSLTQEIRLALWVLHLRGKVRILLQSGIWMLKALILHLLRLQLIRWLLLIL